MFLSDKLCKQKIKFPICFSKNSLSTLSINIGLMYSRGFIFEVHRNDSSFFIIHVQLDELNKLNVQNNLET